MNKHDLLKKRVFSSLKSRMKKGKSNSTGSAIDLEDLKYLKKLRQTKK